MLPSYKAKRYLATFFKLLFGVILITSLIDYFYYEFNLAQSIEHNIDTLYWKVIAVIFVLGSVYIREQRKIKKKNEIT
jgi:hypothetical protein